MTFVASAVRTGHAVAGVELPQRGALSGTLDSIVFPWSLREGQDERRGGPALAALFRIAGGPNGDYFARRFIKYQRTRRTAPSSHWAAFVLPRACAIYRELFGYSR